MSEYRDDVKDARNEEAPVTDTLRDRIAAEDEKHCQVLMVNSGGWACRCGTRFPSDLDAYRKWRLHKADAILAIPGIAVVELPEPDWEDEGGFGWSTSSGIYASGGHVYDENDSFSPDLARTVGAEWLAAAEHAEREQ